MTINSKMEHFCILCNQSTEHVRFYQKLKQCKICSLVSASEIPDGQELETVYGTNYFFEGEYLNYLEEKEALQKNFRKWIMLLRRFAPHGKCFEIGSAYGFFLELARDYWEVKGVDISEHACEYSKTHGLDVEWGDFLDIPVATGKYDIFCLWDTIEHLKTPDLYLKKISEEIAPDGILCLTTGDIDAIVPRIQKEKWRMIHPPTHLFYFSQKTLFALLRKNDFEIVHVSHVGFYRSLKRTLFSLGFLKRDGKWKALYDYYNRLKWGDLSFYLNLYDILLVIARKES
jgi:2-polyprenyl-3-methyl-5-hydroxy-6-metoxy-1,4-benzoquinol methylase